MEKLVIIGGSAGSFRIVNQLLTQMPAIFPHTLILCLHRLRNVSRGFSEALQINSKIKISEPEDYEIIRTGRVYVAPSNYHLIFEAGNRFSLSVSDPVNHSRPSLDLCFDTAAEIYSTRVIGILLSGANIDGAKGMLKIKKSGGLTIVQDPSDCDIRIMPEACLRLFQPDKILDAVKIINFILTL